MKRGMSISSIKKLIIFLQLSTVSNAVDPMNGFGQNQNCRSFTCPGDDEPVPKSLLRISSSGCSDMGGGLNMMSAGKFEESTLDSCCHKWSACYKICGTTKGYCDTELKKCMTDTCDKIDDEEKKKTCQSNASTKELLLSLSQCSTFDIGQQSSCECVSKSKTDAKRRKVLKDFYGKFSPENVKKVDGLLEKSSDVRKFAGLLYKLVSKYPKVIKKVADPMQAKYDDLLKQYQQQPKTEPNTNTEETSGNDDESVDDSDERMEL